MHKVIFDTDPGIDDAMALLFLHRHPAIDLIGITTVFGNASVETTTRNALFLKREWGIDAPVAKGLDKTFNPDRPHVGWPTFIHGDDGLGNIDVPETVDLPVDPRPAHRFIIDTVRAHPGEVTLIAVGRMTNLALALREDPDFAALVREVVIMGGAFDVNGNITPAAEANIHGDPEAADVVMTGPWPVTVVGLDVTTKTVMTKAMIADIAERGGEAGKLLADISKFYVTFTSSMCPTAWSCMTAAPAPMSLHPTSSPSGADRSASSAAASPTARRSKVPTTGSSRRAHGTICRARRPASTSMPRAR